MSGGFVINADGLVVAANVGGFIEVFRNKVANVLNFRTLRSITGLTLTENADDIQLDITSGVHAEITGLGQQSQTLDMGGEDISSAGLFQLNHQDNTIAAGVITPTLSFISLDTEGMAASDDLDTITDLIRGTFYYIKSESNSRDPTIKDGTGNLDLAGDFTLTNTRDTISLIQRDATNIQELSRSDNQ